MEDLLLRLLDMVEGLRAKADVRILHHVLNPGASKADIESIREIYGIDLDDSIAAFYRLANGFQLLWVSRRNNAYPEGDETGADSGFPEDLPWKRYLDVEGCINIWPLHQVFSQDWSDEIYFSGDRERKISPEVGSVSLYDYKLRFKPFDVFSKESCMCFYVDEESDKLVSKLMLASGHYADLLFSKVTDFPSYLEFLIANFGLVSERKFYRSNRRLDSTVQVTDRFYWESRPIRPLSERIADQ